jgi:hypothetical protein
VIAAHKDPLFARMRSAAAWNTPIPHHAGLPTGSSNRSAGPDIDCRVLLDEAAASRPSQA